MSRIKIALAGAALSLFASAAFAQGAAPAQAAKPAAAQPQAADMKAIQSCRNMSSGMRSGSKSCQTLNKAYPALMDTSKPLRDQQASTDAAPPPKPPAKKGS
jgi:hypothetical protein